jgi:DNA-binding transcriptional regulator PaaX
LLPPDWPAVQAEQLFHRLAIPYAARARQQANLDLEIISTS